MEPARYVLDISEREGRDVLTLVNLTDPKITMEGHWDRVTFVCDTYLPMLVSRVDEALAKVRDSQPPDPPALRHI